MLILNENSELNKNKYKIPKYLSNHLKNTLAAYGNYRQNKGYKRLNSLVNPKYNKRNNQNDNETDKYISYNDLKRIDYDIRHMPNNKNNIEFILNGGSEMANFVSNKLNSERNKVEPILKQKKIQTIKANQVKPVKNPTKPIKINEEYDENHPYYNMLLEYDTYYVINAFKNHENIWLPLINPSMYHKALSEFTKFGQLLHFPTKYIYQWFSIIMKNTAILRVCTSLAGHDSYFPFDDLIDIFFYDEDGSYDKWNEYKESIGEDDDYYAFSQFLESIGFYDWSQLPDGSDAISDFGIEPIEKLIAQYNKSMTPEELLILINKILDIYHQRGDLSSMFIEGGRQSLNHISENKIKKIYINEKQIYSLKNIDLLK